jgi:hypothetical protein
MARTPAAPIHKVKKGEAPVIYVLDTDVFTIAELSDSRAYQNLHRHVVDLARDDLLVTTIITKEDSRPPS